MIVGAEKLLNIRSRLDFQNAALMPSDGHELAEGESTPLLTYSVTWRKESGQNSHFGALVA